ncbi:uncharacterized protein LOC135196235 [Macrobrachium nipponense]|uniref:uncharacterized protein LOC135196235 n=1 Tax=Macrobrachium nipponense TaxID=159736 RepID=UPI0030C7C37C
MISLTKRIVFTVLAEVCFAQQDYTLRTTNEIIVENHTFSGTVYEATGNTEAYNNIVNAIIDNGTFNINGNYPINDGIDPIDWLAIVIGGVPGVEYPILATVPKTGFTCKDRVAGYYADVDPEARCQVFHICQHDQRKDSFLCPNGTIFNQEHLVCDWWYNFDCSTADQFFSVNLALGQSFPASPKEEDYTEAVTIVNGP